MKFWEPKKIVHKHEQQIFEVISSEWKGKGFLQDIAVSAVYNHTETVKRKRQLSKIQHSSNLEYVLNEGRWSHLFLTRDALTVSLKLLFFLLVDVTHNLK